MTQFSSISRPYSAIKHSCRNYHIYFNLSQYNVYQLLWGQWYTVHHYTLKRYIFLNKIKCVHNLRQEKTDMLRLAYLIIIGKLYIFHGALKNTNLTYLLEDTSDSNTKKIDEIRRILRSKSNLSSNFSNFLVLRTKFYLRKNCFPSLLLICFTYPVLSYEIPKLFLN